MVQGPRCGRSTAQRWQQEQQILSGMGVQQEHHPPWGRVGVQQGRLSLE